MTPTICRLYLRAIIAGILSMVREFVRGVFLAVADALDSRDAVCVRALHGGLSLHREQALQELAGRVRQLEEAALRMAKESAAPGSASASPKEMTTGETNLLIALDRIQEVRPWDASAHSAHVPRRWPVAIDSEQPHDAGLVITVTVQSQVMFQGSKFMGTDDSDVPGTGCEVVGLFVGAQMVLDFTTPPIPMTEFAYDKVANDLLFPVCAPALSITVRLRMLKRCRFYGVFFGDALQ